MFLEDVVVEGFKSFSESTEMGFQPGIGVIIGNNGSGKSNIIDAILWGLGEDDLDRLRCLERDELFFAGSKGYPPAEVIRVGLNFKEKESDKSPVVFLEREAFRDGRQVFRFNGDEMSREQYNASLADRGLTPVVKAVIKQEQINDMLLLRPEHRIGWVGELLGNRGDDLPERLRTTVAPLFEKYFGYLIQPGDGRMVVYENGGAPALDVEVTLPGDRKRRAHQLSGGEKAVVSLALKLAIFTLLKSPLYLLDEVEPSLDYSKHKAMQAFLKSVAAGKQLIMITHLRSTIDLADTVHGVRTRWDGSSFMKFYFLMDDRIMRLFRCC